MANEVKKLGVHFESVAKKLSWATFACLLVIFASLDMSGGPNGAFPPVEDSIQTQKTLNSERDQKLAGLVAPTPPAA